MGFEQQSGHGFADDVGAANDYSVFAAQITASVQQQLHTATGSAWREHIATLAQAADIFTVKSVNVLVRSNGLQCAGLFNVLG
ncbi:hypothetical protein D3C81_1882280 [compost metagenome]